MLVGCDMNSDPLAYQKGSISTELEFSINESTYEALLALSAIREDGGRDAELIFRSPDEIRGVCVKRSGAGCFLILDGIEIPLPAASLSGFFDIADAFSIDGNIEKTEVKGDINLISILADEGRYKVYLDRDTRTPTKIDYEGATRKIELNVKNFTIK